MKSRPLLLLDSNFFIRLLRLRERPFDVLKEAFAAYEIVTCQMVMLEVLCGMRTRELLESTRELFAGLRCITMGAETWRLAEELAWERERAGRRLGTPDIVIAACAIESGAVLLTHDKRFAEIPRLKILSDR